LRIKGKSDKVNFQVSYRPKEIEKKKVIVAQELYITKDLDIYIWDESKEDKDVINLYINEFLIAENLITSRKKNEYKITMNMFATSDTLRVRIDNVDEGSVPPNTVVVELKNDKVSELIHVSTQKEISKEILIIKK